MKIEKWYIHFMNKNVPLKDILSNEQLSVRKVINGNTSFISFGISISLKGPWVLLMLSSRFSVSNCQIILLFSILSLNFRIGWARIPANWSTIKLLTPPWLRWQKTSYFSVYHAKMCQISIIQIFIKLWHANIYHTKRKAYINRLCS